MNSPNGRTNAVIIPHTLLLLASLICILQLSCSTTPHGNTKRGREGNQLTRELDKLIADWENKKHLVKEVDAKEIEEKVRKKSEENFEKLLELSSSSEKDSRAIAVCAMGFIKDSRAREAIIRLLDDADSDVRANACLALGIAKISAPIEKLASLSKDSSDHVRASLYFLISSICKEVKEDDIKQIAISGLDDKYFAVRNEACRIIAQLKIKDTGQPLLKLLDEDTYFVVRLNAGIAIASLDDINMVPELIKMLKRKDENDRRIVSYTLRQLTGIENIELPNDWEEWWKNRRK